MKILAIESSCDDTSVAILDSSNVLSNIVSSQYFHNKYGGIIPELASRAHLKYIDIITKEALEKAQLNIEDIKIIAVTSEPGLFGSLLVGTSFAKGLSIKLGLPVIPVNHIEGHIYSSMIENQNLDFPFVSLVVSGGHTAIFYVKNFNYFEVIGLTKDDAAGEAFDKISKLLGLGYPGGPIIDKLAKNGNPKAFSFPRPMLNEENFNFSFSGLKTSVRYFIQKNFKDGMDNRVLSDIAASLQEAIIDVLVHKTINAAKYYNCRNISISGGVSANSRLREKFKNQSEIEKLNIFIPQMSYCLDNAAMIGYLAYRKYVENPINNLRNLSFVVNPKPLRAPKK